MKTLLLGNGLNRCLKSEIFWGDLLEGIKKDYGVGEGVKKEMSFPMQFECIVNYIQKDREPSTELYTELKEKIAKKVSKINELDYKNSPHVNFLELNYRTILTTNYDYVLEKLFSEHLGEELIEKNDAETKYSFRRWKQFTNVRIHHIHGEANKPGSLCLGYEHYAGTIQDMRTKIATKSKGSGGIPKILEILQDDESYENEQKENWAVHFFTDDIDIVGLGLSESEIDLWWLIAYRASLKYSNPTGRELIHNKIRYHAVRKESSVKENRIKKNMFKNMGIDYIEYDLKNNDYEDLYLNISKNL